jgi:hypothetical protein
MNDKSSRVSQSNKTKALEYLLTKGFSVIPVGEDKRPLIKWKEFEDRHATEDEIEEWFTKWPNAGVGIVTGKISGITVVDIDVKETPHMTPGNFPLTFTVSTPSGGSHLYYDYHAGIKTAARVSAQLPGVDIRNDGGYVVAPPSAGYTVVEGTGHTFAKFPDNQFASGRAKDTNTKVGSFSLTDNVGVTTGGRNDSITKVIGSMLSTVPQGLWVDQVWPVIQKINATYSPPLSHEELSRTFESIATKEKQSRVNAEAAREMISSPLQISDIEAIKMRLRRSKTGMIFKDLANVVFVLEAHPKYNGKIWFDTFTKKAMFNNRPLKETDTFDVQKWLQIEMGLEGVSSQCVRDSIDQVAEQHKKSSALEWIESLQWDGKPRVDQWLHRAYGVEDSEYHRMVGRNWLIAIAQRLKWPGSKFDHVLVLQGGQGVRKTTSFEVLGGGWHVETGTDVSSKDFLQGLDGNMIVEFSEGDTLTKSQTTALKMVITRRTDKYRAPYARAVEEHPRQCVFCMTTNEIEFLKDVTGNRRWWIVRMIPGVEADIDWLKENRDQLFAESYARVKEATWEVPLDVAEALQEGARIIDVIEEDVLRYYSSLNEDAREEGVTVDSFIDWLYTHKKSDKQRPVEIDGRTDWRVKNVFKAALRLESKQVRRDGIRVHRWFPTVKTDVDYVKSYVDLDFEN